MYEQREPAYFIDAQCAGLVQHGDQTIEAKKEISKEQQEHLGAIIIDLQKSTEYA